MGDGDGAGFTFHGLLKQPGHCVAVEFQLVEADVGKNPFSAFLSHPGIPLPEDVQGENDGAFHNGNTVDVGGPVLVFRVGEIRDAEGDVTGVAAIILLHQVIDVISSAQIQIFQPVPRVDAPQVAAVVDVVTQHFRFQGSMPFQGRSGGDVQAVSKQDTLGIGVDGSCHGGAAPDPCRRHGIGKPVCHGRLVGIRGYGGSSAEEGRRQQADADTYGHQGHTAGVALEPGDGFNAAGDIPAAVGDGGGARCPGIALICHGQEDHAVFPTLLAFQPFQHPLVAEGFHIVADAVKDILHKGIAPVQAPQGGPYDGLQGIPVLQVQQLMEQHLFVHLPVCRNHQHGTEHTADECGRNSLHLNAAPGFQPVPEPHIGDFLLDGGTCLKAAAKPQPQADVGNQMPRGTDQNTGGIYRKEPVCGALGLSGQPGGDMSHGCGTIKVSVGGIHSGFHQSLGGFQPDAQVRQNIPADAGGDQDPQSQHAPDAILPPGRELVPQQPLNKKQQGCRQADSGSLQKKTPKVSHRLIPPCLPAASSAAGSPWGKWKIPSERQQ